MQSGLTHVGCADQCNLGCAFGSDDLNWATASTAFLGTGEFLGEVFDPSLDVRLQVFRTLVLGNRAQHFTQAIEALLRVACVLEGSFSAFVVW